MQPILQNNIKKIQSLCETYHIKNLYAFGSAVSGAFRDDSDIDFLYEMDYTDFDFNDTANLPFDPFLAYFDLKEKLEELLGKKVDLIPNQQFKNKYFNDSVLKTKTAIYG